MQHEITHSAPLLNDKGSLREPGYAKRLLPSPAAPTSGPERPASRNGTTIWRPTTISPWR